MSTTNPHNAGPPLWLLAELTYRCPLQCPYCSNPLELETRSSELSTDDWKRVFDQAAEMGVIHVHLSGGEPTAQRPRFIAGLSEAEWRLPKYFVADITVDEEGSDSEGQWVQLSALTIRDW